LEVRDSTDKMWGGEDVCVGLGGAGGGKAKDEGMAAKLRKMEDADGGSVDDDDSFVVVVQSLETDLRPSDAGGDNGKSRVKAAAAAEVCGGKVAAAAAPIAATVGDAGGTGADKGLDRSNGLSSKALSINRLKSVCLKYWMAGNRSAASSGRSGTRKATISSPRRMSLTASKTGSPVAA